MEARGINPIIIKHVVNYKNVTSPVKKPQSLGDGGPHT